MAVGQGWQTLRIVIEARQGSIFDGTCLETVNKINDETFRFPVSTDLT
jgi:hypothetical protein